MLGGIEQRILYAAPLSRFQLVLEEDHPFHSVEDTGHHVTVAVHTEETVGLYHCRLCSFLAFAWNCVGFSVCIDCVSSVHLIAQ